MFISLLYYSMMAVAMLFVSSPLYSQCLTVVMYRSESWTVKKAECQRIDAFELWCWRRLLGVPWTARRSNQSILKDISPGCSLEGLMLKLKLQYFGHLMRRADSLEKTLMLGLMQDSSILFSGKRIYMLFKENWREFKLQAYQKIHR